MALLSPANLWATGGVSNGQAVNAAVTNAAFIFKNADDSTSNLLSLTNGVSASGGSITNIQRQFNSLASFLGASTNQVYNYLPTWSNNDVGVSTDTVKTRADDLTAKFNSSAGHKHTGAAGDAPQIDVTTGITGTITVANGGTGRTTLTNHGVLVGAGSSAITQLSAAGAGTLLSGVASSDPAFTATPTLGVNGTTTGQLNLASSTGGGASVTVQNRTTTSAWNFNLPTSAGTTGQLLTSGGGGTGNMTWTSVSGILIPPTFQTFTSGSGTYTTPAGVLYIKVTAIGGGGGGSGSSNSSFNAGNGSNGNPTTFGSSLINAGAGSGSVGNALGGAALGGSASLGGLSGLAQVGNDGFNNVTLVQSGVSQTGAAGATGPFGGGPPGGNGSSNPGGNGATNSGAGGGGGVGGSAGGYPGGGGGAGGYVLGFIPSPSATYSYAVGAGGGGGSAGSGGAAGGSGGSGLILVEEYYQ